MFNPYDFYITPEEFAQAEANGICKDTLIWRIRRQGWDKQRALTEPVQFQDRDKFSVIWDEWGKLAEENGVSRAVFRQRLGRGWTKEKAATTPKIDRNEHIKIMCKLSPRTKPRKFSEDLVRLAEKNGIRYKTLTSRVNKLGWDPYIAATTPVFSRYEMGQKGAQGFKKKYGSDFNRIFFLKRKQNPIRKEHVQ
ncbi:hypothetical protein QMZ64_15670 [Bacillus sp. LB7]|uniref:hypothetical protein n=1 Tax=Bacillus sp. LB7 TaxID=3043238 RepID=UPI002648E918|nr:hypothetical protein [Bacillus sp. LB7]MDN5388863.1 hypothetical protein [Bacillus sp. LB7]